MVRNINPFMQGRMRYVFAMKDPDYSSKIGVAKETVGLTTDMETEMGYIRSTCVARYYAEKFRKETGRKLKFLQAHLYQTNETCVESARDKSPMTFFCGEDYIPGIFTKFTNNANYISSLAGTKVLEAFSHFSYVASGKQLMVCDLQGIYKKGASSWTLTDPQVHSLQTPSPYGRADRGMAGIADLLTHHKCGQLCH